MRTLSGFILWLLACQLAVASHIVGGNARLTATNRSNQYFFGIDLYIDRESSLAGDVRDNITVAVYSRRNNLKIGQYDLPLLGQTPLSAGGNPCASLRPLQLGEVRYGKEIALTMSRFDDAQGYYLVYGVCCRNPNLDNLVKPGDTGMVFYLEFPALQTTANSSPVFVRPTSLYGCLGKPLTASFAATDADGDELRYSLVTPYKGFTSQSSGTSIEPSSNYPVVQWQTGFSQTAMVPGNPALAIDPATGQLSVTPSRIGLFVLAVLCEEYRAGQRIGSVRRDFQLVVVDCPKTAPPAPVISLASTLPPAAVKMDNGQLLSLTICQGLSPVLRTGESPDYVHQWQRDGKDLKSDTLASLSVKSPGAYTVVRKFTNTCGEPVTSPGSVTVTVTLPTPIKLTADGPLVFCPGGSVTLTAPGGDYTYRWRRNNGLIAGATEASVKAAEAGRYVVEATEPASGCVATDTVPVRHWAAPALVSGQLTMARGGSVTLDAKGADTLLFRWSPAATLSSAAAARPVASPGETTTYSVTATSPQGCTATAQMLVSVFTRLLIPDAFSPNNDGINDTWVIRGLEEYPDCRLEIYNRWGGLIFAANAQAGPWDGRSTSGVLVPPDLYVFVMRSERLPGRKQGTVLVVH
ncbi:T9SS type B sorting domain-containing protein [Tellurirhabdus rosea]|uniref:T9SS type B sorting domain-containing protein n=1 Tax=Tellurirhabdus rosea TaxID=2674997 RepID=UPI00224CCF4E|nr:gliding motility-associated C-terminal domain-containing protein [Tellurirhabdus rosea]